ncbi:MAG TPA: DUF4388 domain-containing protein, partial [Candidatus Nanopelagicales bacterium]
MPDVGFPVRVDNVLLELASQRATGCLTLTEPEGEQSSVWFRDGLVYAVSVPGRRPLLGVRLMSSGALTPEALAEALEVQRTELQGWRLGELLVHLQFVDRAVVESFVTEQVRDQVADLLHWEIAESKFRNGKRTRQDVAPPIEVTDLLSLAGERDARWAEIVPFIGGADGVPVLSTSSDAASDVVLGPYDWALLCKVDGARTIADLADDCGFTVFEAGMVVVGLLDAGLVEIENLASGPEAVEMWIEDSDDDAPTDEEVGDAVAKVAAALNDINLGPTVASPFSPRPVVHDVYAAPAPATGSSTTDDTPRRSPFVAEPVVEEALADVVSLADEREARDGAEAERIENGRLEAERAEAELIENQRIEAERVEAERVEAERVENERVENERLEAERVENERLEAERVEAERVENERLETERTNAERVAAEEAARVEDAWAVAERLAAQQAENARLEHERLEAERLERMAADAAARAEAERREQERLAALEAARIEAERLAAEEAERIEAERIEAERIEAERVEAERIEAERIEAERVEAERVEAERIENERIEAERIENERIENERVENERLEAERVENERLEAERVEAE